MFLVVHGCADQEIKIPINPDPRVLRTFDEDVSMVGINVETGDTVRYFFYDKTGETFILPDRGADFLYHSNEYGFPVFKRGWYTGVDLKIFHGPKIGSEYSISNYDYFGESYFVCSTVDYSYEYYDEVVDEPLHYGSFPSFLNLCYNIRDGRYNSIDLCFGDESEPFLEYQYDDLGRMIGLRAVSEMASEGEFGEGFTITYLADGGFVINTITSTKPPGRRDYYGADGVIDSVLDCRSGSCEKVIYFPME